MVKDSSYYFLSSTAEQLWKDNDTAGQNKMFACIADEYKQPFFRRVVFKSKTVPEYMLLEMADDEFVAAWDYFNKKGVAGEMKIGGNQYTGLFFTIFKRKYLKALAKAIRQAKELGCYIRLQPDMAKPEDDKKESGLFSIPMQKALDELSPGCNELVIWRHVENLSYDDIALRRKIKRDAAIKMVCRCGKRLREIYQAYKNLP